MHTHFKVLNYDSKDFNLWRGSTTNIKYCLKHWTRFPVETRIQNKVPPGMFHQAYLPSSWASWPTLWPHGMEACRFWTCFSTLFSVLLLRAPLDSRNHQPLNWIGLSHLTKPQLRWHLPDHPLQPEARLVVEVVKKVQEKCHECA